MVFFWIVIFILSLAFLVKGADWFVEGAECLGISFGVSPFIIGVTIVAIGTSFPEAAVSLEAALKGITEVAASTAVGSAIANIFLIVGLSSIVARRLIIQRSLIDLDAPLLATTTFLFLFIMWDKKITFWEGIILLLAFSVYVLYTVFQRGEEKDTPESSEVIPARVGRRRKKVERKREKKEKKILSRKMSFILIILGVLGLVIGAEMNIRSLIKLSTIFRISPSFIAITAVAIGTSLPDMVVSIIASAKRKYEIALGNVFGSNIFLVLAVVGLPALFTPLYVDNITFYVGLPFLVVATFLFIISGISRRIHIWEGLMYLLLYVLFIYKLFTF